MATLLERLEGSGPLDAGLTLKYRQRAMRPDGEEWRVRMNLPPFDEIHGFVAWRNSRASAPASDQPRPPNPQKRLTTIQRAASFATVTADSVKRLATTGEAFLPDDAIEARLAICRDCDQFVNEKCKLCGCGCGSDRTFANKLAAYSAVCPHNPPKWLAIP